MVTDYLHWQFVLAPRWMLRLIWNLERASLRLFSVKLMLKTLIAYWHKDAMSWKGGTITQYVGTIMWNIISRLIGFIIRTIVILLWITTQAVGIPLAIVTFTLFLLWPLLVVVGVATGLTLLIV